jgi:hypothetical protein
MKNHSTEFRVALGCVITSLATFPSTALAHGDFGGVGLIIGIVMGPVIAMLLTSVLRIRHLAMRLVIFFPIAVVCTLIIGVTSNSISKSRQRTLYTAQQEAVKVAFAADPIVQAACALDVARVKALTRGGFSDVEQRHYSQIVTHCAKGNEPERLEIFAHLMSRIPNTTEAYCQALNVAYDARRVEYLQALLDQGSPINCIIGTTRIQVWRNSLISQDMWTNNVPPDNPQAQPRTESSTKAITVEDWVSYLTKNGAELGFKDQRDVHTYRRNSTLINFVIAEGSYKLVMMGLNAGAETDLYSRPTPDIPAPIEIWTLRRFKSNNGLNKEQVKEIQAKFGEISAEQVNRTTSGNGHTLLWDLKEFQWRADGGADFFAYLVSRDIDLSARDQSGMSALHWLRSTPQPLLAEFDRLNPEQFKALFSPMEGPNSLLEAAKRNGNTALVSYLCTKGAKC